MSQRTTRIVSLVLPVTLVALAAVAQVTNEEGEGLLADLGELQDEVAELEGERSASVGEQAAALDDQIRRKREELRAATGRLVDFVVAERATGRDAGRAAEVAGDLAQQSAVRLRSQVEALSRAINELEAMRAEATDEALVTVEVELRQANLRLDALLGALLDNRDQLVALGLGAGADVAFLDERLKRRSEIKAGTISRMIEQRDRLQERLSGADGSQQEEVQRQLRTVEERLDAATESLETLVGLMAQRELETSEYRELLIRATGQIAGRLDTEVALSMMQRWIEDGREWLLASGPRLLFQLLLLLLLLLVVHVLARVVRRLASRAVAASRLHFSQLHQDFLVSLSSKGVWLLGLLVAFSQLGFEIGPLLAGLGVAGFIVGFALQDTLSNFASGMMILAYRPFDVGDTIEAGGVIGKVSEMNLVSTTILTFDNQKLVVPNNKIWGDVIRNVNSESTRRVDLVFGIGYDDDIEHAERILQEMVTGHDLVLAEPAPVVKLHNLGDSSVDFVVRPWVLAEDYWTVFWDLTREVKRRFDAEGLSIPYPQRDVHVYEQLGGPNGAVPKGVDDIAAER